MTQSEWCAYSASMGPKALDTVKKRKERKKKEKRPVTPYPSADPGSVRDPFLNNNNQKKRKKEDD